MLTPPSSPGMDGSLRLLHAQMVNIAVTLAVIYGFEYNLRALLENIFFIFAINKYAFTLLLLTNAFLHF